jgi:cytochrome c oxidase cbb3-type subunit III
LKWALIIASLFITGLICIAAAQTPAQTPPPAATPTTPERAPARAPAHGVPAEGPFFPPSYPVRPPADPAIVQRGKQVFIVSCGFCHGTDARGGSTGPNLVRSQLVLDDQHGELIGTVIRDGRLAKGMPKFEMSEADISDITAYLHSQPVNERRGAPSEPINIVVGDAKAGLAYFNGPGKCSACHAVTGDLAGIGGKYDPKTLQNLLVSGGGGGRGFGPGPAAPSHVPPTTVTVTLASGQKYEGKLAHLSAFVVALTASDGVYRSFAINGALPKVEVHDPLRPHLDMLPTFKDIDIHNLTAYLVTVR